VLWANSHGMKLDSSKDLSPSQILIQLLWLVAKFLTGTAAWEIAASDSFSFVLTHFQDAVVEITWTFVLTLNDYVAYEGY
jgi:hypothetical protein